MWEKGEQPQAAQRVSSLSEQLWEQQGQENKQMSDLCETVGFLNQQKGRMV